MSENQVELPNRWLVFAAVTMASISVSISYFKVTGTMPFIISDWGIDVGTAGLLMSVPPLANVLIGLPSGSIVNRFGARKTFLVTIIVCLVANIVGSFATDVSLLVITRFFEGFGLGMVMLIPPIVFTDAFPTEKRGLPMSLWSSWNAMGALIMINLCSIVTPALGWRANWWISAAFLAVSLIACFLFLKTPSDVFVHVSGREQDAAKASSKGTWGKCLRNPAAVCICVVMFCSMFGFTIYESYYPTFLLATTSLSSAEANTVSTVHTYPMILIALTFGFLLNKVPNRVHPKLLLLAILFCIIGYTMIWVMPTIALDVVGILICATGMQFIMPLVPSLMPDAVDEDTVPVGMALLSFFSGLSAMTSPMVAGAIVDAASNWVLVAIPSVAFAVIGVAAAVIVIVKMRARANIRNGIRDTEKKNATATTRE